MCMTCIVETNHWLISLGLEEDCARDEDGNIILDVNYTSHPKEIIMENQFTPGPWNGHNTSSGQGLIISETTGANVAVAYNQKDTNLLAAAPDMLEALQAALSELETLNSGEISIRDNASGEYLSPDPEAIRNAYAAIQKAMGG